MPAFSREGDLFCAQLITGPSHVWLGVRFAVDPIDKPSVIKRKPIGSCFHGDLSESEIIHAVTQMIAEIDVGYYASEIEYVANDSPRYGMYARCVELIIRQFGEAISQSVAA
ncbi:MAG: hypothetical protein ACE37H_17625 [Phycisphaeraceae bacterium]